MTAQPPSPKRLLRLKEASRYLSISPGKLRWIIQRGLVPVVKIGENTPWLIDIKDLDAFVERHKETL